MSIIKPSRDYLGQSWGASWRHLGHTWGHLGIPSAVWEIWLHALRLATLIALPVPMLRQVDLEGFQALKNGVFAREVCNKWEVGGVSSMLL